MKELWQLAPNKFEPASSGTRWAGRCRTRRAAARGCTNFDDHLLSVGFVTHLNYENRTLSPFEEFQRFKTHPMIAETFEGAKRIATARGRSWRGAGNRLPKWCSPALLVGCSAGFVNVPRSKGSHNAVLSGAMQAADAIADALKAGRQGDELTA